VTSSTSPRTRVKSDGRFLELDEKDRTVKIGKRAAKLSPLEFDLLVAMANKFPDVVTYQELLESVWGDHALDHKDYLKLYVHYVRVKIPSSSEIIVTERNWGYRLTVPVRYVHALSEVR